MSNTDHILDYLNESGGNLCDDCLSKQTGIKPRQQVNQICRRLGSTERLTRRQATCARCNRFKVVNSTGSTHPAAETSLSVKSSPVPSGGPAQPWYWEGNVQSAVVSHLVSRGYRVMSVADTASRSSGKDVEAHSPEGSRLWISVKGYPDRSQHTQARHWFSQAMFDMILYREESAENMLAVALPAGFATYQNLASRVSWFQNTCKFTFFWINEDGSVSETKLQPG